VGTGEGSQTREGGGGKEQNKLAVDKPQGGKALVGHDTCGKEIAWNLGKPVEKKKKKKERWI